VFRRSNANRPMRPGKTRVGVVRSGNTTGGPSDTRSGAEVVGVERPGWMASTPARCGTWASFGQARCLQPITTARRPSAELARTGSRCVRVEDESFVPVEFATTAAEEYARMPPLKIAGAGNLDVARPPPWIASELVRNDGTIPSESLARFRNDRNPAVSTAPLGRRGAQTAQQVPPRFTNPGRLDDVTGVVRRSRFEPADSESRSGVDVAAEATEPQ